MIYNLLNQQEEKYQYCQYYFTRIEDFQKMYFASIEDNV